MELSVNQFFRTYQLPDFLPDTLTIESFSVNATIPVQDNTQGRQSTYDVAGTLDWTYDVLPGFPINTRAEIGVMYDGNRPMGQQFSGSIIGMLQLDAIPGAEVMVGYRFGPASADAAVLGLNGALAEGDSTAVWVQWQGIRATYQNENNKQTLTFTLNGWTVGGIIQALVRMIGDPYFTLPAPWDLLNQISLDGLSLIFDLTPGVRNRISASYTLPKPLNLVFVTIEGLEFKRVEGKVTLAIRGRTDIPGLQDQPLFQPAGEGQDVQQMPSVPGRGNQYFDLRLLVLGQRVGIVGHSSFNSTLEVIRALEGVPATSGNTNPVDPNSGTVGQPFYNQSNNWLVAADFGLLRVGNVYTFDCQIVFNDPDLYGLRLAFNGAKAKVLAGLVIDVLYKKITDDIGVSDF